MSVLHYWQDWHIYVYLDIFSKQTQTLMTLPKKASLGWKLKKYFWKMMWHQNNTKEIKIDLTENLNELSSNELLASNKRLTLGSVWFFSDEQIQEWIDSKWRKLSYTDQQMNTLISYWWVLGQFHYNEMIRAWYGNNIKGYMKFCLNKHHARWNGNWWDLNKFHVDYPNLKPGSEQTI